MSAELEKARPKSDLQIWSGQSIYLFIYFYQKTLLWPDIHSRFFLFLLACGY